MILGFHFKFCLFECFFLREHFIYCLIMSMLYNRWIFLVLTASAELADLIDVLKIDITGDIYLKSNANRIENMKISSYENGCAFESHALILIGYNFELFFTDSHGNSSVILVFIVVCVCVLALLSFFSVKFFHV